jgi:hypothetical protein
MEPPVPVFDGEFELLDYEPATGISTWFSFNYADDTFTIRETQDAEALMRVTQRAYNATDGNTRWGDGLEKVGSIPLTLFYEHGMHKDEAAIKRFLNDRDYQKFRTRPGKV